MGASHDLETVAKFDKLCNAGMTVKAAALECGVSPGWGYLRRQGLKKRSGQAYARTELKINGPKAKPNDRLRPEAARALTDFEYFRLRYCGRNSLPWEVEAANKLIALLQSDVKEYVVINAPPGGGKTTLFTHDIPLWMICKDRSVRMIIGGAIQRNAERNTERLRRTLQANKPYVATDDEKLKGMVDAVAAVASDFGRFRPDSENPEIWTRSAFTVAQLNNAALADKEPTVQAFGRRGGVLGNRVGFCIWDDLIDPENSKTVESRDEMQRWWKEIAETRIDQRGCMVLQGQRLSGDDLYRFVLDMKGVVIDDEGYEVPQETPPSKYKHIVYKAHYDEKCTGVHKRGALKPWPESCLLDPYKLPWPELLTKKRDDPESFAALYLQEDSNPNGVLVRKLWVSGGQDPETGEVFPGCWDKSRSTWQLPHGLEGDVFVYATADPSPSMWWAVQVWAYHPGSQQFFLLDLVRKKMQVSEFLERDPHTGEYTGTAEELQSISERLGYPIKAWIFEVNAAQRWFLQSRATQLWGTKHGVQMVAHTTTNNKTDPKYGVQSLAPLFRTGAVRLPGAQDGSRIASLKLVDEVTKYTGEKGGTDDCVMSMWFGVLNLDNLYSPAGHNYRLHNGWRDISRGLHVVPRKAMA